jgi:hypothetical protein
MKKEFIKIHPFWRFFHLGLGNTCARIYFVARTSINTPLLRFIADFRNATNENVDF